VPGAGALIRQIERADYSDEPAQALKARYCFNPNTGKERHEKHFPHEPSRRNRFADRALIVKPD
jgi:hypothetical protein